MDPLVCVCASALGAHSAAPPRNRSRIRATTAWPPLFDDGNLQGSVVRIGAPSMSGSAVDHRVTAARFTGIRVGATENLARTVSTPPVKIHGMRWLGAGWVPWCRVAALSGEVAVVRGCERRRSRSEKRARPQSRGPAQGRYRGGRL